MSPQQFSMSDYVDVAERIRLFAAKHPEGSLQPLDLAKPYTVEVIGDKTFIVYVAAAYRTADDQRPGVGTAWEEFPGKTPYTRGSELQNAETSAWGRAIVAVLAADTKRIASADEVRNRQAERDEPMPHPAMPDAATALKFEIRTVGAGRHLSPEEIKDDFAAWSQGESIVDCLDIDLLDKYLQYLREVKQESLIP